MTSSEERSLFERRLHAIDWREYETAYGSAEKVPRLLMELRFGDRQAAFDASHELWCGLCHQHAYVSSAALPAWPFVFESLHHAAADLQVEILDIVLGFARCSFGCECGQSGCFRDDLWASVVSRRASIDALRSSDNEEVRDFVEAVIEAIDAPGN